MSTKRPKGTNQGKRISPSDQEAIRQLYAVYGNKLEVARKMGVCEKTVHNVIGNTSGAEFDKVRAESALEMAGRIQAKVERTIDRIDDKKIDRASLPQAGVFIGIGVDKIERLQQHAKQLVERDSGGGLLTPQSIAALISSIKGQVNQMTLLGIKIEKQSPELSERLQEAMMVAESGIADAEVEDTPSEPEPELDFYNAPPSDDSRLPDEPETVDRDID